MESNAGLADYPQLTSGAVFKNNISYRHGPTPDIAVAGSPRKSIADSDYNFMGDGKTPGSILNNSAFDQKSLSGDPGFASVDPVTDTNLWIGDPAFRNPNPNFGRVSGLEFLSTSPCIDAGTDVGQWFAAVDGDNDATAAYDIGAYEYGLDPNVQKPDPDPEPEPEEITSNAVPETTSFNVYNNIIKPSDNTEAVIIADVKEDGKLTLKIYDTGGREITTLFDGDSAAGSPVFRWKGTDSSGSMVGSGIYFVHMKAGSYTETKKIAVVK